MKTRVILLLLCMSPHMFIAQSNSPSVIGAAGKSFAGSYGSHSFSIGQAAFNTVNSVDSKHTQGFHQPWPWVAVAVAVGNDSPVGATNITASGNGYPSCGQISGNCSSATASPEDIAFNGVDVWYKFTALSSACRIKLDGLGGALDGAIALYSFNGSSYDLLFGGTENVTAAGAVEILNYSGLTAGSVYHVAIGSYSSLSPGGPFALCIQHLLASSCADGTGNYSLCTNFKPVYTGAHYYTFNFAQTAPTVGITTSASSPSQLSLSSASLSLHHNYTYSVSIDALYNLFDGAGVSEQIAVPGMALCDVTILPHSDLRTKLAQRCPASVLKGSVLQAKPFICSALNHTIEFTEVSDCTGSVIIGIPFYATTIGSSSTVSLATVAGVLSGHWYAVRWRPNFSYGAGVFGTSDVIQVGGSSMDETTQLPQMNAMKTMVYTNMEVAIYPNPNKGDGVNLEIAGANSEHVSVEIIDAVGRIVHQQNLRVSNGVKSIVTFENVLQNGTYILRVMNDNEQAVQLMIVSD